MFSSPDASPAFCSETPASAAIEIGMNANAVPAPAMTNGPARFARKCPWTGAWVAHSTPAPISAIPAAITILAPPELHAQRGTKAASTEDFERLSADVPYDNEG